MNFVVGKEYDGAPVLAILQKELRLSRGMIKHLKFLDDGIMLNGERVTVRKTVNIGDILTLNTENERGSDITPCDLPLGIIYEDSELVVPDKPPFMPTHPSHDHYDDTVANALAFRYRDGAEPYVFRPVNRLDRNTSGLLIVARNRIAAGRLYESMLKKEIRKRYIAVLDGVLPERSGRIETYLRRSAQSIIVREVCPPSEDADYALTEYTVLAENDGKSVVLAEAVTGRTHQLRVHFASIDCAIVGDDLYGKPSEDIKRHALHATEISFPHPADHREITLRSHIHNDMERLIKKLFGDEVFDYEL